MFNHIFNQYYTHSCFLVLLILYKEHYIFYKIFKSKTSLPSFERVPFTEETDQLLQLQGILIHSTIFITLLKMLSAICILLFCFLISFFPLITTSLNLTLPYQHPYPEAVVQELQRYYLHFNSNFIHSINTQIPHLGFSHSYILRIFTQIAGHIHCFFCLHTLYIDDTQLYKYNTQIMHRVYYTSTGYFWFKRLGVRYLG